MTRAWRIVKAKHASQAFDGEGARLYGGRWNSPGRRAVYASSSVSLATLEMLVHLPTSALLTAYRLIPVELASELVEIIDPSQLPREWTTSPAPALLQALGDAWLDRATAAVLQVPSAIVPFESNFLLNPAHPAFGRIAIGKPIPYPIDPRLI
jgi:RES domain-containing protein